tara:strand:- start:3923 stop:4267 length:345 start_codon:yes stop_codon:yes gene_type:complete
MKSPFAMKEKIPDSSIRSKSTISTSETKKGNKSKSRDTIEVHDIEGDKKGKKFYIDTKEKTKNNKSKFKEFSGDEGEKGYIRKTNKKGKTTERRTTKGGAKRRIKKAEKNLKDI